MMKTLRRQEGGTKAAAGRVLNAGRTRVVNEGAAAKDSSRWLEAERAIWGKTEKPLSDDRRFLLVGQWVKVISQCEDGRYHGRRGWLQAWQAKRIVVELQSFGDESVFLNLGEEEVEILPPLPDNEEVKP